MNARSAAGAALFVFSLCSVSACTSTYYATMHKLGKEKRDILVSRIKDGKKDQDKAKEQLKTTMEAFQELTGFQGGDLEKTYNKLNKEYESAQSRADKVSDQVKSIDKVANDLFREWTGEIEQMQDRELKSKSRAMLRDAQSRHEQYMTAMHATEKKMEPVLQAFHDQVTFLKHNLNARAIKSLKGTAARIDNQVQSLMVDIEKSMKEADAFVASLSNATEG